MQHKKVCKLVASDSRSFIRAYDDLQLNEVLNLHDDAHPIPLECIITLHAVY